MDGRGGCCIARYAGCAYDMSKVDQIMLRFRPIAPKPAANGGGSLSPASGGSPPSERSLVKGRCRKGKRGSLKDSPRRVKKKRKASSSYSSEEKEDTTAVVVTLPLLPDTPVGKSSPDLVAAEKKVKGVNLPTWITSFNNQGKSDDSNSSSSCCNSESNYLERWPSDRTVVMGPQPARVTGSCVTVECVTDTWTEEEVDFSTLGSTDEEMRRNLERDACPGFVSDAWNRVTWTNAAYRRMVAGDQHPEAEAADGSGSGSGGGGGDSGEIMGVVWVVMKERMPWTHVGFTCRVRVQYTCGMERKQRRSSITVPCDVWRMNGGGGFAWRLDVDAALSLGR